MPDVTRIGTTELESRLAMMDRLLGDMDWNQVQAVLRLLERLAPQLYSDLKELLDLCHQLLLVPRP